MQEDTDAQLIIDYLRGDEKSLEILISRYLKPIYNFAYRYVKKKKKQKILLKKYLSKLGAI